MGLNLPRWSTGGGAHSSSSRRWHTGRHRPTYDINNWSWGCGDHVDGTSRSRQPSHATQDHPVAYAEVDMCKSDNRRSHHTDLYQSEQLIIRRGQLFQVKIQMDKSFDKESDNVHLHFAVGSTPQRSKNTLVRVPHVEVLDPSSWGCIVENLADSPDGVILDMSVMSPCDAIVGEYTVQVERSSKEKPADGGSVLLYKQKESVYILYNAWCKEDVVYVEDEDDRNEYVMNESGRVYVGGGYGRWWIFGQFEKVCLEAALYLLDISYLNTEAHGNVVQVSRALSAMVNSNDQDKGVLMGNWSGNYTGGTSPSKWNSSPNILSRYMKQKRAVRYGQCWVFSAVTTTLARALGIPTRSVTNFSSAHDTDLSMTIDTHIDMNGRPLAHLDDSVWNFHVWNESWFRRVDLPEGNDGWQVYDATPQERSDDMLRCGPAPVAAIKEGNVFYGYDTKFVFAEVNGDRLTWQVDAYSGDMHVVGQPQTSAVGKNISTKAVGSTNRNDITDNYKYPEGSEEEREVVAKVSQYSSRKTDLEAVYKIREEDDVEFRMDGTMAVNGSLVVNLTAVNKSEDKSRTVQLQLYAIAKYYTGVTADDLDSKNMDIELEPKQEKKETWNLEPASYLNKLDEDASLSVHAMAQVKQTAQIFTDQQTYELQKPDLQVEVTSDTVKVGDTFPATVSFSNPLGVALTSASVTFEGLGIQQVTTNFKKPIQPDQTVKETVNLSARLAGKREVIASLHSKQLTGVDGAVTIQVVSK